MGYGLSTINTVLKLGGSRADAEKLCKIKSYPDLGGPAEALQTTDFEDFKDTYVPGVETYDTMQFTANYNPEDYKALLANERVPHRYHRLEMGEDGDDGIFVWLGSHCVHVAGKNVDEVREMVITCAIESEIKMEVGSGSIGDETGKQLVTNKGNPIGFIELN